MEPKLVTHVSSKTESVRNSGEGYPIQFARSDCKHPGWSRWRRVETGIDRASITGHYRVNAGYVRWRTWRSSEMIAAASRRAASSMAATWRSSDSKKARS